MIKHKKSEFKVVQLTLKEDGVLIYPNEIKLPLQSSSEKKGICIQIIPPIVKNQVELNRGLCHSRFYANITLEAINDDIHLPKAGTLLTSGDIVIKVTQKRKKCFPECSLVQQGEKCSLVNSVIFAEVLSTTPIEVKLSDKFYIL